MTKFTQGTTADVAHVLAQGTSEIYTGELPNEGQPIGSDKGPQEFDPNTYEAPPSLNDYIDPGNVQEAVQHVPGDGENVLGHNNQQAPPVPDHLSMQVGGGGTGMRLGLDQGHVGGQAVVEGYNQEQGCGGDVANTDMQVGGGGGSPFNSITNPYSGQSFSIFSNGGKSLLKAYVKAFQHVQSGGQAPLEGVDPNVGGALYDGLPASAENLPGACDVTYDAQQPNWTATQMGGAEADDDADDHLLEQL